MTIRPSPDKAGDPKTLPGNVLMRKLWKTALAQADRASDTAFVVTLIASFGALWFLGSNWFIPAAILGVGTRAVLLAFERDGLRLQQMSFWMHRQAAEGWERETGTLLPRVTVAFRLWLESSAGPTAPAARRADAFRYVGDLAASRAVLEGATGSTPLEVADLECSRFELQFDETGRGDLGAWQEAVASLSGEELRHHRVEMATYEAAMDLRDGHDSLSRLKHAYFENGPFDVPLSTRLIPFLNRFVLVAVALGLVGLFELFV